MASAPDKHEVRSLSPRFKAVGLAAILAALYFVSGKLGLKLAFVHPSATAVWPPAGIALAAFLVLGSRAWAGVLLGAFLVNVTTAGSVATSAGIALGNLLEAFLGSLLVNRYAGGLRAFERPQDVFRFAILAGVVAAGVSPTLGASSLCLGGYAPWSDWGSIWLTWWLGDAGGTVIVAPLLLLCVAGSGMEWTIRRLMEAALLLLALGLVGETVFGPYHVIAERKYPLEFLCFPILVWAAFRFGPRETAGASFVLTGIAIWGTLRGTGAFARETPNVSLLLLQAFLGVITVMAMALAAAVLEQRRAHEDLRTGEAQMRLLERRQAEEALRAGELALGEAQALAHVGSWSWDATRDAVASDELFRICGLEPKPSVERQVFLDRLHPEDRNRVVETVRRSWPTGEAFALDHRVVRPDGSLRWVHSRGQVVLGNDGPLRILGTVQDITERRHVEEGKSQFIANAAHELRTPLTTMIGMAEIVAGFRKSLTLEQLEDYCRMIQQQGERARRLITGLLDLSQMEQGLMRLDLQPVDLASAVRRALDAVPFPDGRQVRVDVPEALMVVADSNRLEEALVNLLRNAWLYGGASVTLQASASGSRAVLTVADDGAGVPDVLAPHLFEPFTRGKDSAQKEGTGLGLAIARGMVEAMGGTIEYEAGVPRGAQFVIRLEGLPERLGS